MADNTQTATTILAYQVDQSSVDTALATNTKIVSSYADMAAAAAKVGLTAEELSARTGIAFDDLTTKVEDAVLPMDDLATATERVKNAANGVDLAKFDRLTNGGGIVDESSSGGFNPLSTRRGIQAIGSLAGGQIGGDLGEVAKIVSASAAFGVLGAVVGVGAIAIKGYSDTLAASTERAKAFGDALEKAFSGTSVDIQGYIKDTQAKIAADTAVRDSLQKLADAAPQQLATNLDNASQGIANFLNNAAGSTDLVKPIDNASISQEAYNAQVDEYNKKIQLAQIALDAYNLALGNNIVATNSAAGVLTAYADDLTKQQVKDAQTQVQAQQMTATQRADKIRADLEEQAVLAAVADKTDTTSDAYKQLNAQYADLGIEIKILSQTTNSYADQLAAEEAAKKALTDQNTSYLDLLKSEGATRDAITADLAGLAKLRTDASAKEAENIAAEQAQIASIEQDGADKRAQIAQDSADAIARIEQEAGRSEFSAIANRDAVAFTQAQIKEKDALDNQKKADTKALAQQATAEAKSIAQQKAALDKQNAQIETSLQQQTQIQQQKLLQDQTDLINITNAELAIGQNASIGIVGVHEQMWQSIESVTLSYANRIMNGLSAGIGSATSGFTSLTPLPAPTNGYGTQGAVSVSQVQSIVRNQMIGYLGGRGAGQF